MKKQRRAGGVQQLARVLDGHARHRARRNYDVELGRITTRQLRTNPLAEPPAYITVVGGLKLDTYEEEIPIGDCEIVEYLTAQDPWMTSGEFACTTLHTHTIPQPPQLAPIAGGDRVLVYIIDADSDAPTVVIAARLA